MSKELEICICELKHKIDTFHNIRQLANVKIRIIDRAINIMNEDITESETDELTEENDEQ